jgi:hypothetical protein
MDVAVEQIRGDVLPVAPAAQVLVGAAEVDARRHRRLGGGRLGARAGVHRGELTPHQLEIRARVVAAPGQRARELELPLGVDQPAFEMREEAEHVVRVGLARVVGEDPVRRRARGIQVTGRDARLSPGDLRLHVRCAH